MADGKIDAEMAEEDWLRCVFLKFAYKCCKVQRTCKEERVGPVFIIGGNRCQNNWIKWSK